MCGVSHVYAAKSGFDDEAGAHSPDSNDWPETKTKPLMTKFRLQSRQLRGKQLGVILIMDGAVGFYRVLFLLYRLHV